MEVLTQCLFLWLPFTTLLLCALSLRSGRSRRHGSLLPPGPRPLPIIGSLLLLGDKPHHSLARLAKSYGPIMSLKLGQVTTIVISSPEMAREVLQKKDQSFCGRYVLDSVRALHHSDASLVWQPAGEQWRNLRRICSTQLFKSQKINDNQALRQNKVEDLIAYVRERCSSRETVDIGQAAYTAALNSISNTFFSIDLGDMRSESAQNFRNIVSTILEEVGKPNLSDFFPVIAALDVQGRRRRVANGFRKLHRVFDELIDKRMVQVKDEQETGNETRTKDFLDSLLQCLAIDGDLKLDRHVIKTLLADLFVGGTDSTSNAIEWAMAELVCNPSSMKKAQAEVMETIGYGNQVDESNIQQLPYLQAIVKETFRLHPPFPLLVPHKAETTVELCGLTIPEGTRVLVNAWAIGRDEDIWKNSECFMPERFLERDVDYKGKDFELIPFGAGRRICPGLPLAYRMVHLVLASLLLRFDWKLPEGMNPRDVDMTEKFGFSLTKATALQAIPVLR